MLSAAKETYRKADRGGGSGGGVFFGVAGGSYSGGDDSGGELARVPNQDSCLTAAQQGN